MTDVSCCPDTPDYPAAHSMDTEWFAIDADGHIGVFDSGEDGAVPHESKLLIGVYDPDEFARHVLGRRVKSNLGYHRQDLGYFRYSHNSHLVDAYERTFSPRHPVNVDELPDDLQEWIKPITRLRQTKFTEHPRIQPIEHVKCRTWRNNPHWIDAAQDRVTVFQNGGATWFAVDKKGAIAIFWTDNTGAVPRSANHFYRETGIFNEFELAKYLKPKKSLQARKTELIKIEKNYWGLEERHKGCQCLGLYLFEHPEVKDGSWRDQEFIVEPYKREAIPDNLLTVDDLTEEVRSLLKLTQFSAIAFDETAYLQPLEHLPCNIWDGTCAWLDTHGTDHWDIDAIRRQQR